MAGNQRFASYIKNLRDSKGWTQEEVEAKTDISHASISRMERALQDPEDPEILKKLAVVYEVPLEKMLEAAGRLEVREFGISPDLFQFNEVLKQLSPEKKEELLNYAKYLKEQMK